MSANPLLSAIDTGLSLSGTHVTVYFAADGEKIDFVENHGAWTAYDRSMVMAALETFAAVTNLTFSVTQNIGEATFKLTKSGSENGSLGFMNGPDPALGAAQGVAWFNDAHYWGDAASGLLDPGSYTFTIFLHEFGHGLGLAHPHDTGGGSTLLPQVGGGLGLDQGVYTVMTYNDGWPESPSGLPSSRAWGWNAGPSPLDVAVLQEKYGANMETGAGRSRYDLSDENTGYAAIWDVGGRDEITYDGVRNTVIDLRAATLKTKPGGGGYVSHVEGVFGGFTIAKGVNIEVAKGGNGRDKITGNGSDNRLSGDGKADLIKGLNGADTLFGGSGKDNLFGGLGDDTLTGGQGADQQAGGRGADLFVFAKAGHVAGDVIKDFKQNQGDMIDLSGIDAQKGTPGNQSFTFSEAGFTGAAGQIAVRHAGGKTLVEGDRDGDGLADFTLTLNGALTLGAGDFLL